MNEPESQAHPPADADAHADAHAHARPHAAPRPVATYPGAERLVETADGKKRYLVHCGEGFRYERMPQGTRVIYPPPPLDPILDRRKAIEQAIDHPHESDPLDARLKAGMKVTICFDDISLPLPSMERPDIRQTIIEVVLERLDRAGVDDIHLVVATGLHRFMWPHEIRHALGDAVYDRFAPDRLYNFDAEDPDGVVHLGMTDEGEDVEVLKRAVESDLLIYVNINLTTMDGGPKSLTTGISTYKSIRHHHRPEPLLGAKSLMDPSHSTFHDSLRRIHKIIMEHVNLFTIETTLNSDTFPHAFGYLSKNEDDYSAWDRASFWATRKSLPLLPFSMRRKIFTGMKAPYGLTGVHAGKSEPVHERTIEAIHKQQVVPVDGQADVLIVGVDYLSPYDVNSIMNPLLVWCLTLGYVFNMYIGKPLVRKGGVLILYHPLERRFDPVAHPSYIDFYDQVLPEMREPAEIHEKYEEKFAYDERYRKLYREKYAFHGIHPMYMWSWGVSGMKHYAKVVAVAPKDLSVADRLGFETAPSLEGALERAEDAVGADPKVTYFHFPPIFLCHVR